MQGYLRRRLTLRQKTALHQFQQYQLQEQLEAMIEEAARQFIELADMHVADKPSFEPIATLVKSVQREVLQHYSYDTR